MAANPSMGSVPNHVIYRSNTLQVSRLLLSFSPCRVDVPELTLFTRFHTGPPQTYNILEAARVLGYDNVVLASSETLIGWPLDPVKPDRLPITEEQPPRPESSYSLSVSEPASSHLRRLGDVLSGSLLHLSIHSRSKLLGETMASEFCRFVPRRHLPLNPSCGTLICFLRHSFVLPSDGTPSSRSSPSGSPT